MKKTIGILAHVDAGKTTFCEQLLFHTNSIKQMGRVDHKTAYLDSHEIEKARGITIFSDVGMVHYKEDTYYLVDTPGHVDFSPEMERAIHIMDYAIIIISAKDGIEGHTETVWHLLMKYQVPTFFFINKIDQVGANPTKVLEEIQETFRVPVFEITNEVFSTDLIEYIAEQDDNLLKQYLEGHYQEALWKNALIEMILKNEVFLCGSGSALQNTGVRSFFESFHQLTKIREVKTEAFSGRIFKIRHDESGAKLSYIKVLSGSLKVRDEVTYQVDGVEITDKINQIRIYNGKVYQTVSEVETFDICVLIGITEGKIGTGLNCPNVEAYQIIPTLTSKVIYDQSLNTNEVLNSFKLLEEEDPSLHVVWESELQEIHLHVMGVIQLEVLERVVLDRFLFQISFEKPEILYKETIVNTVCGYGHYEPLRHYAEVHLRIEPSKRGSGVTIDNVCHPNALALGIQNNILHYLIERQHHGILTGSSLTDVKITLLLGLNHQKHTHGGDFKEATIRALRQGLEKAQNRLLEPVYDVKIKVDIDLVGKVISDIEKAKGTFSVPEIGENKAVIKGRVPVATFMDYPTELAAFTQGRGMIHLQFGGYELCHNEEEVIKQRNYQKNADLAYPSSSVFCAKGESFVATWDNAENYMHGLK